LYQVTPSDRTTLVVVTLAIVAAAVAAAFVPARRATRIQPVIALRYE
jgi:ABC-type antimicrobial peptide transport system permease subunit